MIAEDMAEKELPGSGGYAIARVTDEEQKKGNLGGPELFLAGIGRLDEDRFVKHYCNKCEKAYEGSPALVFENPNEELGEGVTLIEKGEYKCKTCNATIAQYRKFDAPAQAPQEQQEAANTALSQAPASKLEEEESPSSSSFLLYPLTLLLLQQQQQQLQFQAIAFFQCNLLLACLPTIARRC